MMHIDGRLDKAFNCPDSDDSVGEETFRATLSSEVQESGVVVQDHVEGPSASCSPAQDSSKNSADTHQVRWGERWF